MTIDELEHQISDILSKNPDWLACNSGEEERFKFVTDCQRVIRELLGQ